MEQPFEVDANRYQPEAGYIHANEPERRFAQRRLAAIVGIVAMGLPLTLGIGGWILNQYELAVFRKSLSGFYYEEVLLGDLFVGGLIFIGSAMLAYRGWSSKISQLASAAGVSAYLVALFPADGWYLDGASEPIFEGPSDLVHLLAALVLFAILAWFCFFIFTKVEPHQRGEDGEILASKLERNRLYKISGAVIVVCMVAIGISDSFFPEIATAWRVTYWAETFALLFFGFSWLIQGRVLGTFMQDPRDETDQKIAAIQAI